MSSTSALKAEQFLSTLDLSTVPTYTEKTLEEPPPRFIPQAGADQAVVVGSQLQGFVKGIDAGLRGTLANAMLLAQLAATA
jgi:hypothetical protein